MMRPPESDELMTTAALPSSVCTLNRFVVRMSLADHPARTLIAARVAIADFLIAHPPDSQRKLASIAAPAEHNVDQVRDVNKMVFVDIGVAALQRALRAPSAVEHAHQVVDVDVAVKRDVGAAGVPCAV